MFPDKAPFHYKCRNCGYFFTTDEKLNAPSGLSFASLDFEDAEKDENGNVIFKIPKCPKCPKCKENAVVSVDYMVHK